MNDTVTTVTSVAQSRAVMDPGQLLQIAVQQGADIDKLERLMDLQQRWEKDQARKAFNAAFAAFKAEAVTIVKNRKVTDGPLKNKSYAELHSVVNAVTPALSKHGLSASWRITKDERDWVEVTCSLSHIDGHTESVALGGPPDSGGAKNAIQQRASTVTYLERYTLKALLGVAEEDDDTDGRPPKLLVDDWSDAINSAMSKAEAQVHWQEFTKAAIEARDNSGYEQVKAVYAAKIKALGSK